MMARLKIADHASALADAGFPSTAQKLLDAVRCCDFFPECSHALAFADTEQGAGW